MNSHIAFMRRCVRTRKGLGKMNGIVKIVLADDHALVRSMLAERLSAIEGFDVVAVVGNADDAIAGALRSEADVVVFDIDMPGLSCFDAARRIRAQSPRTQIVFLSAHFHDRYIEQALDLEAAAYVTKSEPPEKVIEAIRTVAEGGVYFSPEVRERIVVDSEGAHIASKATRGSRLTARELEVLGYLARGLSKKEIAESMCLSVRTVENHTARIMSKLDIHDRVQLARYAIREGLAQP
ncbi:MAG: DNA-binding response regulator [Planctomycetota bacterium]|nr:MAG: DNA-binding response regulator [Planctomycetota bacterium]